MSSMRGQDFQRLNFQCVLVCDILFFYTSLQNIVLRAIICPVFADGIDKFFNQSDSCLFTYSILKSIPLLQRFSKIVRQSVFFYSLEFLLYMTETQVANITFTWNVFSDPGNDLFRAFLLTLKFVMIFELFIKNKWHWPRIFLVCECVVPKSCKFSRIQHFSSSFLVMISTGPICK